MTNWNELIEIAGKATYTPPPTRTERTLKVRPSFTTSDYVPLQLDTWDAIAWDFVKTNVDRIRYIPEFGRWMFWNEHIWVVDASNEVNELVKMQGRAYMRSGNQDLADWGKRILTAKGVGDILKLAKTDQRIIAHPEEFDADVYKINTPAGLVDLWTGEVTPPTPSMLVKRSTNVAPDIKCATALYDRFMAETFAGDPDLSEYVEIMLGVSLVKAQSEQVFLYMHGLAGSGKGTLMNLAQDILGVGETGYTQPVDSAMFIQRGGDVHPTEYMQLLGARLVISSEVPQNKKLDSAKLKKTTGGDKIVGRYMGKDFVSFDATHTLWIMANDRLQVPHSDGGVWRRLREIPFLHAKGDAQRIGNLHQMMVEQEGPGILAKWIARAQQYFEKGIYLPDSVVNASKSYVEEQNTVSAWIEAECDVDDPLKYVVRQHARTSYLDWCKRESKEPVGDKAFTQALADLGYSVKQKKVTVTGSDTKKNQRVVLGLFV